MANVASAEKRNRQRIKRRERNLQHLVTMRTRVKRARAVLDKAQESPESVTPTVEQAIQQLAKAAQKGVIHKKTASRKISRLTKALNKVKPTLAAAKKEPAKKEPAKKPAPAKKAAAPKTESKK
ncbi:MAG: 30S ribosomal protein S20 [Myxococcales bacterium]|nr:30S ribosomal protein S20 [Myxococcales bacterium]